MTILRYMMAILILSMPGIAQAQLSTEYHPLLTSKFSLSVGAFLADHKLDFRADGAIPGDEIDFDEALNVDSSDSTFQGTFRWNFGEKWSLWGQGWSSDLSGQAVLAEDIEWDDLIFKAGSNVKAGVDTTIVRLFFGRDFSVGPQHEFGAGLGVHWMKIDPYIEGEVFVNDESTGFQRASVSVGAPLPNIGAWYYYSPTSRWLLSARVDWLDASIGDFSGGLWNVAAGANFQLTDHFGITLDYQFFQLNVDVDSNNWIGSAKTSSSGPFLALTANW